MTYLAEEGTLRFAVIGASGRLGGCIAREARFRGYAVTAVLRDPSKLSGPGQRLADVFQPATVTAAAADSEVVISAVGHAASLDDAGFYVRAAESLVAALRALGTVRPRLIVVGGFGSLRVASGAQLADVARVPDHARAEVVGQRDALSYYRTVADIRWTYFSPPPGGVPSGTRTGSYQTARDGMTGAEPADAEPVDAEPAAGSISAEDFAVAVVDEAERGEYVFACVTATN
jgi:putative NADH-flavin reductase